MYCLLPQIPHLELYVITKGPR